MGKFYAKSGAGKQDRKLESININLKLADVKSSAQSVSVGTQAVMLANDSKIKVLENTITS